MAIAPAMFPIVADYCGADETTRSRINGQGDIKLGAATRVRYHVYRTVPLPA
jgi:hypothetical protein